jgi:hypothetical protein
MGGDKMVREDAKSRALDRENDRTAARTPERWGEPNAR